ncbi:hypothetical protein M378DRAFT_16534 [Amanita muscaria Koide BX008]|uniref:Uncharacterized protein n=1 Tax=Amanita muscaria (strain Koide BX008) TaxID=946122 RepID=A0A0C2WK34_AMAMK|nr:hypothetical protein M378DRAFT_16534 [Amanita muscaria Koide BX008]
MALHIATTCGLDTSQEADDVVAQLPDELKDPPYQKAYAVGINVYSGPSWLGENAATKWMLTWEDLNGHIELRYTPKIQLGGSGHCKHGKTSPFSL